MPAVQRSTLLSALSLVFAALGAQASQSQRAKDLLLPLCVNGECGLVDEHGTILVPFSKKNLFGNADFKSVYCFVENKKYGLKNRAGEVLIAPLYDNMQYLADGRVAVMKGELWGVVNLKGATLIAPVYNDFTYYENAGAFAMQKGERHFLFNTSGQPFKGVESDTLMQEFDKPDEVKAGFGKWIKVEMPEGQGSYLFNTQTQKKTKVYKSIYSVRNGHVLVENEKQLRTLVNADGQEIFPFKYDSSLGFPNEGWIAFRENGKFGFLDMKGNVAIPAKYDYVGSAGKAGALVGTTSPQEAYGVIDRKGGWVVQPTLTNPGGGDFLYDHPQVPIAKDGKMGVYDLNTLQWVLPPQYEWASTSGHFIAAGDLPPGQEAEANWGKPAAKKQPASPKAMGLFNHDGSVLLPAKYRMFNSPFAFGADGYTFAWKVQGENQAVISPEGVEIIGLMWPKYVFRKPGLIIGGQELQGGGQTWEAYYDEAGKLLLQYKTDACDQQQIVTGDQRVIWPLALKACKKRAVKR